MTNAPSPTCANAAEDPSLTSSAKVVARELGSSDCSFAARATALAASSIARSDRESSEWENEFRRKLAALNGDLAGVNNKRAALLNAECLKTLRSVRMVHGLSKTAREVKIHYGSDAPATVGTEVPVWIRDGWEIGRAHV